MILSHPVLMMHLAIIQRWLWRVLPRLCSCEEFMIPLEQGIDHRGHLPGESSNDFFASNQSMGSFVCSALARQQTLIDLLPLGIPLNGSPYDEIHRPFHLPNAAR